MKKITIKSKLFLVLGLLLVLLGICFYLLFCTYDRVFYYLIGGCLFGCGLVVVRIQIITKKS